ncbi:MAG TPA: hypothetical protein IGS31_14350 [Oscillatoriales cyanobacterium M4454_W2019_049]|nr:hypothetical protein [Oscillatoriales cyanobacterium M4454_W2019_049]
MTTDYHRLISRRLALPSQMTSQFHNAVGLARELAVSLKTLAQAMGIDGSGVPDNKDDR